MPWNDAPDYTPPPPPWWFWVIAACLILGPLAYVFGVRLGVFPG